VADRGNRAAAKITRHRISLRTTLETTHVAPFLKGVSETGQSEGRDFTLDFQGADLQYERLPALAADLVRRQVSVLVSVGTFQTTLAAKNATSTIPIIFSVGVDPVQHGLVASLRHPGGNLTGNTNLNTEIGAKRLQLLYEMIPSARSFALLVNPSNPDSANHVRDIESAARALGLELHVLHARNRAEFAPSFETMKQLRVQGLVIALDGIFVTYGDELGALAVRHDVPAIFAFREFPAAGGLMSYGSSRTDQARLTGIYAGRVLKGEKPSDLPVLQATKIELIINMKTARLLGISVPLPLRGRAEELIE
jgi:putative tryptophan/tyrosine transport system substrate-binding protein